MVLPASDMIPPADETYYEYPDSDHQFLSVEKPRMLVKKDDSLQQQEKQISVDPISLIVETAYPRLELPPPPVIITGPKVNGMSLPLPLLPPAKTKFLSTSLPSSTTSSPRRLSSSMLKKKWKNQEGQLLSPLAVDPLSRQHSVALTRLAQLKESHLRRSKSCGEGRATAPSDDFDLWSMIKAKGGSSKHISSFHKTEAKTDDGHKSGDPCDEEKFKCGALCLFLPGFGRGKPVRPRKEEVGKEMAHVISRTVSLEKFECGSWTSSAAIVMENEDSRNLFFDLPLELIRNSVNDADSPVTAAFVFDDKDHRRGVLKSSSTSSRATVARKSHDSSSRHVRFSTSSSSSSPRSNPTSPTSCITPRLRKAREDFNAFLEAQSA